jgi:hypothetical protein
MPWCNKCGAGFDYSGKPTCKCSELDIERSISFHPGHNEGELLKLIRELENRIARLEAQNEIAQESIAKLEEK